MVSVGLIGLGAIGRLHFDCWAKSPHGKVIAIASRDPRKRADDWPANEFNLGDQASGKVELMAEGVAHQTGMAFGDELAAVRDSKQAGGPVLAFPARSWAALLAATR